MMFKVEDKGLIDETKLLYFFVAKPTRNIVDRQRKKWYDTREFNLSFSLDLILKKKVYHIIIWRSKSLTSDNPSKMDVLTSNAQ